MHAGPLPADCAGPNGRISLLPRGSCVVANNVVDGSRGNNLELLNTSPDLLDNTFIGAGSVGLLVHGHFAEPAFGPGNKINGSKDGLLTVEIFHFAADMCDKALTAHLLKKLLTI